MNGAVTLVHGERKSEGTIKICKDEQWGTVCDDSWDGVDAAVVCRQLGLPTEGILATYILCVNVHTV